MQNFTDHVLRLRKAYYKSMEPFCKQQNLTRNELDVLLFLCNHPALDRASDIVTHRGIAKSHVSQSVASLEQRGLLLCQTDPTDRRAVHLRLSETALPIAAEAVRIQQDFFRRLCGELTQEDIDHWNRIARKLQKALEEMEQTR